MKKTSLALAVVLGVTMLLTINSGISLAVSNCIVTMHNQTSWQVSMQVDNEGMTMPANSGMDMSTTTTCAPHTVNVYHGSQVVYQVTLDMSDGVNKYFSVPSTIGGLDEAKIRTAIISYYNSSGVWAGIFRLDTILRTRFERISDNSYIVHAEYHYTPIPGNRDHRTDSGVDKRTFNLEIRGGSYIINGMGDYQSARF